MSDELSDRLAKNVRQLRSARGMTQAQVARLAGLPRATWANLESRPLPIPRFRSCIGWQPRCRCRSRSFWRANART
jgi:hypothetical protein